LLSKVFNQIAVR